MTNIAIVYHSGFGHTAAIADAITAGANDIQHINAKQFKVEQISNNLHELDNMDAIIFGSPTYMGSVSARFKMFMDDTSEIFSNNAWKNKVAAGFTNSYSLSGDKLNVLIQMAIFAAQHGMIWVGQAEPNNSPPYMPGKSDAINRLGSNLGLMAQSENDPPYVTPPSGDLATAKKFGERIAIITKQFTI